jgi:2-dehydropantoate 2-reductase
MNLLIWGAGAIGGSIGAYFIRAGHAVTFVDRDQDHVNAINASGLRITGPIDEFVAAARAFAPVDVTGEFPTILLCVKAQDTEAATGMLLPHLSDDGCVVSVQNGLNESTISGIVGNERTVGSFINFGADYLEPGVIHYAGRGAVVLGEIDGKFSDRIRQLHELFLAFEKDAVVTDNIWGYLWSKLAYGAMLFATALTNDAIADAFADAKYRMLYIAIAQEVLRVADAVGIEPEPFNGFDPRAFMPDADIERSMRSLDDMVAFNRLSTKTHTGIWRDLAVRKRRTEVDPQLGPILANGSKTGVPTPLTARLIELIHDIEEGKRSQNVSNLDILKSLQPETMR